jgi:hypothetical protein
MMAAPGPPEAEPTAVQCPTSAHEIALKFVTVAGMDSSDHTAPPSVVAMMLGDDVPKSLAAWHVDALAHETALRVPTPEGTLSWVHAVPPSVVEIMTGLPKMPNPTAVQSAAVGHEIPLRPLTAAGIGSAVQA